MSPRPLESRLIVPLKAIEPPAPNAITETPRRGNPVNPSLAWMPTPVPRESAKSDVALSDRP